METESEPFEGEARTPESPYIVAPPTCHVKESVGSGTSGAKSTSLDSTAPLLPDHPLTHTAPVLVPIVRKTARMAVFVSPVMSPGLSVGMTEVAAMFDSAFRKRFRSFYDSSPSPTPPVRKRYRGTSNLILGTDSEEGEDVEESLNSDSESKDVKDEGPTADDEDPTTEDEGLAAEVGGPDVDHESYGLDGENHGVDDEIHGLDDETPPVQTPPSLEGTSGSLPISPSPSIIPSPASPPMILLTVPSLIASPMATSTATISVDEDQFIEVGAQLELYRGILQDHTQRLDAMPPTLSLEHEHERTVVMFGALWRPVLALKAWVGRVDTQMTDMSWTGYDDHRLVHDMLLQQAALQRELQEMMDHVIVLEYERDQDEGLAAEVGGPDVDHESYGLDGENHGVDDEIHGDDES
nr:hypothetical protein [Tanacetum cinerariifolium]